MDTFYFDWLIRQVVTETIVLAFWLKQHCILLMFVAMRPHREIFDPL